MLILQTFCFATASRPAFDCVIKPRSLANLTSSINESADDKADRETCDFGPDLPSEEKKMRLRGRWFLGCADVWTGGFWGYGESLVASLHRTYIGGGALGDGMKESILGTCGGLCQVGGHHYKVTYNSDQYPLVLACFTLCWDEYRKEMAKKAKEAASRRQMETI